MKTILILLIGITILYSCNYDTKPPLRVVKDVYILDTISIERCQYFVVEADGSNMLVHKGNCTNPIHGPIRDTIVMYRIVTLPDEDDDSTYLYLHANQSIMNNKSIASRYCASIRLNQSFQRGRRAIENGSNKTYIITKDKGEQKERKTLKDK